MRQFPPFRLDVINQCLWRQTSNGGAERVLLRPKAFGVLRYLVEHPGRLVTPRELFDALWTDTIVEPAVLKSHILEIRTALGDRPKNPLFIETLPRRGYQFIAPVSQAPKPDTPPPAESIHPKLVGRDEALGELRQCLARALQQQRQIAFITGEAGIGKTALADEFARRASADSQQVRIARAQCIEGYGGKEAYYPMLEAVGQLCRDSDGDPVVQVLAELAPTWFAQFPALVKPAQRDPLQREIRTASPQRMLREIGDALEVLSSSSQLILIFEDLHWVDHSTVDLISALARRRAPARLMLLATYRPVDLALSKNPFKALKDDLLAHRLCVEIALKPLSETQVLEYLSEPSSFGIVPDGFAAALHRRSEGNPLFMVAAIDHLLERGLISRENGGWQLKGSLSGIDREVPENLRQMIQTQIERLTDDDQRALELAAVAGLSFSPAVIAAGAGLDVDEFEERCDRLSRRHQVVRLVAPLELPNGRVFQQYEFVHALYREVLYQGLSPGRRAKLNRSIGESLERLWSQHPDEVACELAQHFEDGLEWQHAIRYLQLGAEVAGRRYAHRQALALLRHALELTNKLTDAKGRLETEILLKLASIYFVSFDHRGALDTYQVASSRAAEHGLHELEVRALIEMAFPVAWISSEASLQVIERALRISAEHGDPLTQARTRASCLVRRVWARGWNAADVADFRAALAEIRRIGDRATLASHLIDYSFIQWISSEYREARRSESEGLAILLEREAENPYLSLAHWESQLILPWILLFLGEWGDALREVRAAIAMMNRNGDAHRAQTMYLHQGWIHLQAMDFSGVVSICQTALPFLQEPPWAAWRRFCLALTGAAEAALGNHERARESLTAAIEEMNSRKVIHDWYTRMILESGLTEVELGTGDLPRGRAQAERFLEITLRTAERTWQSLAWEANARAAIAQQDFSHAKDCVAKALSTMEGFDVPLAEWRVHATAGKLYARMGKSELAQGHRKLSSAVISRIANSMAPDEPLRKTFLSAAPVREVLGLGANDAAREPATRGQHRPPLSLNPRGRRGPRQPQS